MAEWTEQEYVEYLQGERRLYAWVMERHGGLTAVEAETLAVEMYPYQASDEPWRELVFHHEAWHWAMSRIHKGRRYWLEHPELARPSAEYRALG